MPAIKHKVRLRTISGQRFAFLTGKEAGFDALLGNSGSRPRVNLTSHTIYIDKG